MRKAALVAGGAALVLALTACGGKTGGTGSAAPAPGEDKGALSALFSDPIQLADAAKAGTEKSKSAKFTMETAMSGISMKGSGQASYANDNPQMSLTMDMMGMQIEMRLVDKVIYMKMPENLRSQQGITKEWVKVPLDDPAAAKAFGGADINELMKQNDPSKMLEQLKTAGTIKKSEKTTLDGQAANHYSVDLDFAKMKDLMPSGIPAEAADQLKGKNFIIPMELFVNSDNLPLKIEMDMGPMMKALVGDSPQGQKLGEMKMIAKYSDWGSPVNVQAPPADQVGEMPKK